MGLDIVRADSKEQLFKLNEDYMNWLSEAFEIFTQKTGIIIDPYKDTLLVYQNLEVLIRIIDELEETGKIGEGFDGDAVGIFNMILKSLALQKADVLLIGD